jgi:hypothetical protein
MLACARRAAAAATHALRARFFAQPLTLGAGRAARVKRGADMAARRAMRAPRRKPIYP